jgi:glycosyltransferase involved in cell wall biosynthesis
MRIGIYVDVAMEADPSGIGYHVVNLVRSLGRVDDENEYLLYYRRNPLGRDRRAVLFVAGGAHVRLRPVRFPGRWAEDHPSIWWNYYLPNVVRRDRVDVFHGPNHLLPAIPTRRAVVTIHDLAYFKMELYGEEMTAALRSWTMAALERAGRVIAISENTRADIESLGVDPAKIRLIYAGGHIVPEQEIAYDRRVELRRAFNLPDRYLLFVGTLGVRKNLPLLLRAFAALKRAGGLNHGLVVVGKRDSASEQVDALIRELGIEGDVIVTGYVDAWQLPLFYKMADLFVLPTFYEGFTLVTLEAMAYGVPVIATDTSSIREGTGDAAMLVPVDDVDRLADGIQTVLTDEGRRREMIERGRVQAGRFSWERCARETLDLYRELQEERRQPDEHRRVATASGRRS